MAASFSERSSLTLSWWGKAVLASALAVAIPLALSSLWLWVYFGTDRAHFLPCISDSVHYWHEILNMVRVPFDTGYYGYQETHAALGRWGVHAPWVILAYAWFVKLAGPSPAAPLTLNAWFLGAGVLAYFAFSRADGRLMARTVALAVVFAPFHLGLSWMFPDMLNAGLALALAGLIARALEDANDRPWFWALLALCAPMILVRASWLPLIPLFVLLYFLKHRVFWLAYTLAGAGVMLASWAAYTFMVSPYPFKETLQFFRPWDLFSDKLPEALNMIRYSAGSLFRVQREILYANLFGLTILAVSLAGALTALWKRCWPEAAVWLFVPFTAFSYVFGHFFKVASVNVV